MKIAIPFENGRLHGHFGGCPQFALIQVDAEKQLTLSSAIVPAPEHQPGLLPRWLREQGVQVVIAGGIGRRALELFARHGITVRAGWPDAPVEALTAAYLAGQLTASPDGCNHHEHHHGHPHRLHPPEQCQEHEPGDPH